MALSIETHCEHPEVGRVKVEDTVGVTSNGPEGLGDLGRQWTMVDG
jgi:Xaa-Pro aminopeptidase